MIDATGRRLTVPLAAVLVAISGKNVAAVPAPDDALVSGADFEPSHSSGSVEVLSARTGRQL